MVFRHEIMESELSELIKHKLQVNKVFKIEHKLKIKRNDMGPRTRCQNRHVTGELSSRIWKTRDTLTSVAKEVERNSIFSGLVKEIWIVCQLHFWRQNFNG